MARSRATPDPSRLPLMRLPYRCWAPFRWAVHSGGLEIKSIRLGPGAAGRVEGVVTLEDEDRYEFAVLEMSVTKHGRARWSWRVCATAGNVIMHGSEATRARAL